MLNSLPSPQYSGSKRPRYKYPCDAITATLIVNNFGSFDDIMKMSFEGAVKTYACLIINSVETQEGYGK